jgi:hypothetical protein
LMAGRLLMQAYQSATVPLSVTVAVASVC